MLREQEYRQQLKLESIFTPIARRHRDEYFQKQKEDGLGSNSVRFIHYTSAEAALSIIRSKRLWMRNALCMSDFREWCMGLRFFKDSLQTNLKNLL